MHSEVRDIANKFYTYTIRPDEGYFIASVFVYLTPEEAVRITDYGVFGGGTHINPHLSEEELWDRHIEDFEAKIEDRLVSIGLCLDDFRPINRGDIVENDLSDILGSYPFQLDVWGEARKPILRVNLKIYYEKCYDRIKQEVTNRLWELDGEYKYAVVETRQGRIAYVPLDNSTHEEVDEESGIWGQISPKNERGWFIPIEDIESIEPYEGE